MTTRPDRRYNGHRNRNHWNVSLWLNNDEGLYRMMLDAIRSAPNREAAASQLHYELAFSGNGCTPDGVRYSKSAIRAAMVGLS